MQHNNWLRAVTISHNISINTAAVTMRLKAANLKLNSAIKEDTAVKFKVPAGLSGIDKQFINDRFMDKDYIPRSYFEGATPENDYKPSMPYTIEVSDNPYSYQNEGYATLYTKSGGADSARQVQLRKAKDGKWYLWEQFLLSDIRKPESADPWA